MGRPQSRDGSATGGHNDLLAGLGTPQKLGEPILELANGNLHDGMAMWPR
jgi:hypothetical protein